MSAFSAFSDVDTAADPRSLIRSLDESAKGLAAMKHYMAATHARCHPSRPVLDVGSGAGHDLDVLGTFGLPGVGVDRSSAMVQAAAGRTHRVLVQADGRQLPFCDKAFGGCWIERVLMNVADPAGVVAEAVRCLEPGATLTIFEPDWTTLMIDGSQVPTRWITVARHPAVGSLVGDLLSAAGCSIVDRVEERSWWTFDDFVNIVGLDRSLDRAVANGDASRAEVRTWLAEQQRRAAAGQFRAEICKILWVATTPAD